MFKRILLPVDGSQISKKAAEKAITLAKELEATLIVTNIMDQTKSMTYSNQENESKQFIKEIVDLSKENDVKVESMALFGSPIYDIVTVARKSEADMIVMGTQGNNPTQSQVLGSFAYATLKNVDLPILLIK